MASRVNFITSERFSNNRCFESTTNALEGYSKNTLNQQFRTNSNSAIVVPKRERSASSCENENALPNSPPQTRPPMADLPITPLKNTAITKRIKNPTQSPVLKRAVEEPVPVSTPVASPAHSVPIPVAEQPTEPLQEEFEASAVVAEHVDTPAPKKTVEQRWGTRTPQTGRKLFGGRARTDPLRNRDSSDQLIRGMSGNRAKACMELCETEKRYKLRLEFLSVVRDSLLKAGLLSAEEARVLFCNLEQLQHLSEPLSAECEAKMQNFCPKSTMLAPVLDAWLPAMKIYGTYVMNVTAQQELFLQIKDRKGVKAVLEKVRCGFTQTGATIQDLQNCLAEPFQRVFRYPLIMEEILRHTPKDHPDFSALEKSHNQFSLLLQQINKDVRNADEASKYVAIKQLFGSQDQLKLEEGNDKVRRVKYIGTFQDASGEPVYFHSSESSMDLIIDGLDENISGKPKKKREAPSVLGPELDVGALPRLKKDLARLEPGRDRPAQDAPSSSRVLILTSDLAIVAYWRNGTLEIDFAERYESLWYVANPSALVLAFPGGKALVPVTTCSRFHHSTTGVRQLVVQDTVTRLAGPCEYLPAPLSTWQARIVEVMTERLQQKEAKTYRSGHKICLSGTSIVIEKTGSAADIHADFTQKEGAEEKKSKTKKLRKASLWKK